MTSRALEEPSPSEGVSLSDLQYEVMRPLWTRPDRSVAEVVRALRPHRDLAHTTVATVLTRLEKRGVVSSRRDGRQLLYRAEVEEPQVRRSMVAGLVGSLFGGDAKALVAHLIREDEISAADLAEIRLLLSRDKDEG